MSVPIVGHTYYGRHYLKTNGTCTPPDCRFEWYAGDGTGLNFVFGLNTGTWPEWGMESAIVPITVVNGTSFICRNFVVNNTAEMWSDGLMIIDLTAAFGAGMEPDKAWCDENIPYFDGTYELDVFPIRTVTISGAQISPNPSDTNSSIKISVNAAESTAYLKPYTYQSGEIQTGEV